MRTYWTYLGPTSRNEVGPYISKLYQHLIPYGPTGPTYICAHREKLMMWRPDRGLNARIGFQKPCFGRSGRSIADKPMRTNGNLWTNVQKKVGPRLVQVGPTGRCQVVEEIGREGRT